MTAGCWTTIVTLAPCNDKVLQLTIVHANYHSLIPSILLPKLIAHHVMAVTISAHEL